MPLFPLITQGTYSCDAIEIKSTEKLYLMAAETLFEYTIHGTWSEVLYEVTRHQKITEEELCDRELGGRRGPNLATTETNGRNLNGKTTACVKPWYL